MNAGELRSAFTGFFAERGHTVVPSASLIPHDPSVLFTIAGMVPFKPYFLGEEAPPWPRATSVQKCFRTVDIEVVGTTERHCTFFEMLGNFSFGDYFKPEAIPMAWELVTSVLGIDGDRLWVTVYETDDEAEQIWADGVGVARERIQRMGEDNFWKMGETGPCGPSSEIYFDRGEAYGEPGGPAAGGPERYVEIWNLVFMQSNRLEDGGVEDLPRRNIDTGAGLERILPVVSQSGSLFSTDVMAPIVATVEEITGRSYGRDHNDDVAIRILADHARAMAMLVADGVLPANEGRGYVLRRVLRRAVLRADLLGVRRAITPELVAAASSVLGDAYPELARQLGFVCETVEREEGRFRRTLDAGSSILAQALDGLAAHDGASGASAPVLPGDVAFTLHDTHGFPIELTVEIARERGAEVDMAGFDAQMEAQRTRARGALKGARADLLEDVHRELIEAHGPTVFVGYSEYQAPAHVLAVVRSEEPGAAQVILDRTPFYAEGGGQIGDTGAITTETGKATVVDTQRSSGGLVVHVCRLEGTLFAGQDALAAIDVPRREGIRRNHTSTHLLHAALREVLGDQVRQQGSLVAPDRLRFDFSSPKAIAPAELAEVEAEANAAVLQNSAVRVFETSKAEAQSLGALAFFGDKYGEVVRVVEAGPSSRELCGGTHVDTLGMIGPISIVSEASIGSGTRRIEAVSGVRALELSAGIRAEMEEAARLLKVEPAGVLPALEKLLERQRELEREVKQAAARELLEEAGELAREAAAGGLAAAVARRDGVEPELLRRLAQAVQQAGRLAATVLAGSPDGSKAAVAVATDGSVDAASLVKKLATMLGGGGGGSASLALAGGRDKAGIDAMLDVARNELEARGLAAGPIGR
ncbi:MAG: alanine--tRNA ligase [Actinobacteria bacterium]|nr:alanine--tRNA ligase [Actinomycetota bacterium]